MSCRAWTTSPSTTPEEAEEKRQEERYESVRSDRRSSRWTDSPGTVRRRESRREGSGVEVGQTGDYIPSRFVSVWTGVTPLNLPCFKTC